MTEPLKRLARRVVPARLLEPIVQRFFRVRWVGSFPDWNSALRRTETYDSTAILEHTLEAARAVRDGAAAWERDSVCFAHPECNRPLVAALTRVAAKHPGLTVVDFGGAMGSAWWQNREWLQKIDIARWCIVEQPRWVEMGRREFEVGPLRFYASLAECCEVERPTVILFSSVLQYLERPHELLDRVRLGPFMSVIFDRTLFVKKGRDRLMIQRVPRRIYRASYPCWAFERSRLIQVLGTRWETVLEWRNEEYVPADLEMAGALMMRDPQA